MANKENIKKWVDALRSGKYQQIIGRLGSADKNEYCCLGVACEVALQNGLPIRKGTCDESVTYDDSGLHMPQSVVNWLGLKFEDDSNPLLTKDSKRHHATALNDTNRYNFNTIADWIEATYLSV